MAIELVGKKILVIDDDVHVAQTMEMIFLARGFVVRVAYSAEEAIDIITGWEPDIALVDVMLPCMNGIEFGSVLKENYPNAQVILVSGHPGSTQLLETARSVGKSFEILAKPLHPTYILEVIAKMLPGMTGEA